MARRVVVLTPFAVWPPRHGLQQRVAGILGHLGPGWEVVHFSQAIQRTDLPLPARVVRAAPRWIEHRNLDPVSNLWLIGLTKLGGYPAAYADRLLALMPRRRIRDALQAADTVLVAPHHQLPWVRRHTPAQTGVVVDLPCIEAEVYPARRARWTRAVAAEIRRGEQRSWQLADMVFASCEDDAQVARRGGARDVVVVPNGVDADRVRPVRDGAERREHRRRLGLAEDARLAVFVGSAGSANRRALRVIESAAPRYAAAGVVVAVVGRVGVGRRSVPGILTAGEVADVVPWLGAADVAICPLVEGSGTSLKTVEYLAAGLPVVSTEVGVRGLDLRPGSEVEVVAAEEMPDRVAALLGDPARAAELGAAARRAAVARFGWPGIGAAAAAALDRLAESRHARPPR